ncbi:MAG: hypothetical protein LBH43_17695, partial [Treponema sp.]|nr:hypothetical protein [Treponema sp.]
MAEQAPKKRGLPSKALLTTLKNHGIIIAMAKYAPKGPGKIFSIFSEYLLTNCGNCSIISLSLSLS